MTLEKSPPSSSSEPSAAASLGGGGSTHKSRGGMRRRKAPSPRSILDQQSFVMALDDRGILDDGNLTMRHVTNFYQALHRCGYPPLPDFVQMYESATMRAGAPASATTAAPSPEEEDVPSLPPQSRVNDARRIANRIALPKALLKFLSDPDCGFVTLTSRVAASRTSDDGSTTKLVVELADHHKVESVIMRYTNKGKHGFRASLCVSSQVGCAMACTFCATGTMGLTGNLTGGEILEQLVHANRILRSDAAAAGRYNATTARAPATARGCKGNRQRDDNNVYDIDVDDDRFQVRNVVFMGMGEPLDNYGNVVEACRAMIDRKRWNLAHGRVTVSTVGIVPKIRQLTSELPEVNLALSLHAPFQDLRASIVPSAKNYSLESLVDALDGHQLAHLRMRHPRPEHSPMDKPKRRAMIEYVMLEGPTSTLECAHELGRLCEGRNLTVNLIPYNPTDVKDRLRCPTREHIQEFRAIVASYGSFCTVRRTMGADIASACGQLVQQEKKNEQGERISTERTAAAPRDIEDYYGTESVTRIQRKAPSSVDSHQGVLAPTASPKVSTDSIRDTIFGFHLREDQRQRLVRHLTYATTLAASSFIISSYLFLKQSRRR